MSSIIKVDTIQNQSGANIISESSNTITVGASGDTITVPSGATLGGAGTVDLSSATVTLNDSMKMTPAFKAHRNSNFTAADSTAVVIVFDDEEWDTDSAYDTTTGRFTVPSGKEGKYMFYASTRNATSADTTRFVITLRKNGTGFAQANNNNGDEDSAVVSGATTLAVGDYVDATVYQNTGVSRTIFGDDPGKTTFFGFKIIGA